jgi:hypothetical protein
MRKLITKKHENSRGILPRLKRKSQAGCLTYFEKVIPKMSFWRFDEICL